MGLLSQFQVHNSLACPRFKVPDYSITAKGNSTADSNTQQQCSVECSPKLQMGKVY